MLFFFTAIKNAHRLLHEYTTVNIEKVAVGYQLALKQAGEYVLQNVTAKASLEKETYKNISHTIMRSKLNPNDADIFSNIATAIWMQHTASNAPADADAETPKTGCMIKIHEFANMDTKASRFADGMYDAVITYIYFSNTPYSFEICSKTNSVFLWNNC